MLVFSENQVLHYRMRRQMLTPSTQGRGREGTLAALRIVQPAPQGNRWLTARIATSTDQQFWELVAEGEVVQARFFRNTLGWVLRDDLSLFLDACAEESYPPLSSTAVKILALFDDAEALTTDEVQAGIHGTRAAVRTALAELGRRQLVVESPKDAWRLTSSMILRLHHGEEHRLRARGEVISRFLADYGPATLRELADWSGWSRRIVQEVVDHLMAVDAVTACQFDASPETRFVREADVEEIMNTRPVEHAITFLACYDPVVRAQQSALRQRYGYGCSIPAFWHYLLVDGAWCGALHIHYKMQFLSITKCSSSGFATWCSMHQCWQIRHCCTMSSRPSVATSRTA